MPTLNINGIKIYYEIKGKGEPIVLIGGLSADLTAFETIADDLAGNFMVLSFDNHGAGRADRIKVPTLILRGKCDKITLYELAEELHGGIKDSKMKTFKGSHLFFLWERKEFTDAVIEFLISSGSENESMERRAL